eukprot:TRINITY_DN1880_c0_g1_i18.p1 TRINITY_DN1880_c0_g1~~TRINITY_DN1880_c0_g1_i18.p1  ORF type:complete len:379 (-),score=88.49 TRINITY_DN1880_c0_g1_i18:427-1509(-)
MEERDWECWAQVVPWLRVEELVRLGKTCRLAHSLCAERATTIRAPSLGHITFYSYLSATTRKEKKSHHNTQKKGHHMETELERLQALIGTQQQGLVRLQALIGTQQQGVARQLALIDTQQQGLVRRQQELESQRALIAKLRVLSDTQQQALIDMQQQQEPNTQRAQIEQMDSALAEVAGIATQLLEVALRACDAAPRQIPETLENMLPKEVFAVVMFINIVGYTELTRLCTAEQAFTVCKRLAETSDSAVCAAGGLLFPHQLESKLVKIKDIGDCQLLCGTLFVFLHSQPSQLQFLMAVVQPRKLCKYVSHCCSASSIHHFTLGSQQGQCLLVFIYFFPQLTFTQGDLAVTAVLTSLAEL